MQHDYYKKHDLPEAVMPACPVVKRLQGQKALVTGAATGIGRAIAIALGLAGADVRRSPGSESANVRTALDTDTLGTEDGRRSLLKEE